MKTTYFKKVALSAVITQTIALSAFAGVQQIDNIKIASSVPQDQGARLIKDIQILKGLNFANPDPNMIKLMQIPDANGATLAAWMEQRVNYIVDENFALDSTTISESSNEDFEYPNGDFSQKPTLETATKSVDGSTTVHTMMLNIGGALYYGGKQGGSLLDINLPGIGKEEVTSPRIGLVKVGVGLFGIFFAKDAGKDPLSLVDTMPYVAERLSTLIHEARHSDGNGTSLSFFHAVCPDSVKTYAGFSACDRNLNGPYEIEASFFNSFAQNCPNCSAGDVVAIKAAAADAASREILSTVDTSGSTQEEISSLESQINICKIIATLPPGTIPSDPKSPFDCANTAAIQAQIDALQASGPAMIPSTMWDATPEGTFSAK